MVYERGVNMHDPMLKCACQRPKANRFWLSYEITTTNYQFPLASTSSSAVKWASLVAAGGTYEQKYRMKQHRLDKHQKVMQDEQCRSFWEHFPVCVPHFYCPCRSPSQITWKHPGFWRSIGSWKISI